MEWKKRFFVFKASFLGIGFSDDFSVIIKTKSPSKYTKTVLVRTEGWEPKMMINTNER